MSEQIVEEELQARPAPAAPAQVSWAGIPRVNLLPLAIIERRRFRRTQAVLGVAVVGVIAVAAGGVVWAQSQVSSAQDDVDTAQARVTQLTGEQAKFAAVPQIVSQVEAATAARSAVMANDIAWYTFVNDLAGARPTGVTTSSIALALSASATDGSASSATGGANPLSATGIGTLTLQGEAPQYKTVSAWLDALDDVDGVDSPALTSATKGEGAGDDVGTVTYSLSGVLTDKALTHRYDEKKG